MLFAVSALALAVGSAYGADSKRKGFNDLDKDKNGSLSRSEAAANPEINFKDMDRDHDGKLTRSEYLRVMAAKDARSLKRKVSGEDRKYPGFNDMDKDKDGALSSSEAKANPDIAKKFKEADKDGDGKLTRSEYLSVMARQDANTVREKVAGKDRDNAGAGKTAKEKSSK
jgi:Ca2+-binding EF-hand superfamily protein